LKGDHRGYPIEAREKLDFTTNFHPDDLV